jgi:hypothetical protein
VRIAAATRTSENSGGYAQGLKQNKGQSLDCGGDEWQSASLYLGDSHSKRSALKWTEEQHKNETAHSSAATNLSMSVSWGVKGVRR